MKEYPRKLTLLQRAAYNVLSTSMSLYVGSSQHAVIHENIHVLGVRGFFRYLKFVDKFYKIMDPVFGTANCQMLIGLSALLAGCGYCSYGHTLTGALMEFKDRGHLHPIHPFSIEQLFEYEDSEIRERLDTMLSAPGFEELRVHVDRMYRMFLGDLEPENMEDDLLKGILDFWRWTMECSIVEGIHTQPGEAKVPHRIGRDKTLRERYDSARAAERATQSTNSANSAPN